MAAFLFEVAVRPWITQPGFQRPRPGTPPHSFILQAHGECRTAGSPLCPAGRAHLRPRSADPTRNALLHFGGCFGLRLAECAKAGPAPRPAAVYSSTSPVFNSTRVSGGGQAVAASSALSCSAFCCINSSVQPELHSKHLWVHKLLGFALCSHTIYLDLIDLNKTPVAGLATSSAVGYFRTQVPGAAQPKHFRFELHLDHNPHS